MNYKENRPKLIEFKTPEHIDDFPVGTTVSSGQLIKKNSGWRTFKPVINKDICVNCLNCYIFCPDGVVYKSENKVDIDYDFCKGCGVCANECKVNAITMVKEGEE